MARTGLSMNAICLELLRPEIKRKLKELKEDWFQINSIMRSFWLELPDFFPVRNVKNKGIETPLPQTAKNKTLICFLPTFQLVRSKTRFQEPRLSRLRMEASRWASLAWEKEICYSLSVSIFTFPDFSDLKLNPDSIALRVESISKRWISLATGTPGLTL